MASKRKIGAGAKSGAGPQSRAASDQAGASLIGPTSSRTPRARRLPSQAADNPLIVSAPPRPPATPAIDDPPPPDRDWHKIDWYRRANGQVVIAVQAFRRSRPDSICRAKTFANLAQAAQWLETLDPIEDLRADFNPFDPSIAGSQAVLQAVALRQRADRLLRDWQSMVGEFLFELEPAR